MEGNRAYVHMRQGKIFWSILKRTHADKIVTGFGMYFLISALVIMLAEPGIHRYGESIWYCFSVITTIGFGYFTGSDCHWKDCLNHTGPNGSSCLIIPGIVATYYMEVVNFKNGDSGEAFMYKLEHLDELSKDELKEISEKVKSRKFKL